MDFLNWFITNLHMDLITMLLVFCSGFAQARFLPYAEVRLARDETYDSTLKTLVVSVVFVAIYITLVHKEDKSIPIPWVVYFLSYTVATSLYELLIKPFTRWIIKIIGGDSQSK